MVTPMDSGQMNVGAAATLVQSAQELVDQSGINQSSPSKANIVNDDEGKKLDFAQFEEFDGIKCAKIVMQDVEPEIEYWKPSITDKPTMEKSKLGYARVLIGVKTGDELPDEDDLINEKERLMKQEVFYEWRPTKCTHCKIFRHSEKDCKKKHNARQVLIPQNKLLRLRGLYLIKVPQMFKLMTKNVGGLNSPNKQEDIKDFLQKKSIGIVALVENRIREKNLGRIYNTLFFGWGSFSNRGFNPKGRIWTCWRRQHSTDLRFYVTFVYGHSEDGMRKPLWDFIRLTSHEMTSSWCVSGDFNNVSSPDDRLGGQPVTANEVKEFKQRIQDSNLQDIAAY
ncbi:hypothetical protein Cgig2_016171 [Carnegiea gigantea]|uniref:Uncharacterized protein n=1 Tax=Carnegiea gigantea TaxID=171969 RepID=A0A9Q1KLU5_9CARY|nr:hypothetical protein Cgig2_016171 [Carnegiea gigantea]